MPKRRKIPPPTITSPVHPGMMNLDAMWIAAGRPKGKEPITWIRGAGRASIKRALGLGQVVTSNDLGVQAELQAIMDELQRERTHSA